jgi:hypothetical protein
MEHHPKAHPPMHQSHLAGCYVPSFYQAPWQDGLLVQSPHLPLVGYLRWSVPNPVIGSIVATEEARV